MSGRVVHASAVFAVLRADLRRRWAGWLAIGALGGLLVGGVLVSAAGARRTANAFDHFATSAHAADLRVGVLDDAAFGTVAGVAGIENTGRVTGVVAPFVVVDGRVAPSPAGAQVIAVEGAYLEGLDRLRVVEGRLPRAGADEGVANGDWLAATGLRVGDTVLFRMLVPTDDLLTRFPTAKDLLAGLTADQTIGWIHRVTVVGRALHVSDVSRDEASRPARLVVDRDAAARMLRVEPDRVFADESEVLIDVAADAQTDDVVARLRELPVPLNGATELAQLRADVATATRPYVLALWAMAALAVLAGLGVVGGALAREAVSDAEDHARLRALGMGSADLRALVVLRASVVASVVVVVAGVVMVMASPVFPVGPMGSARRGWDVAVDSWMLLAAVVVVPLGAALVSLAAVRAARRIQTSAVGGRRRRHRSTLPLTVSLGVRLAMPPPGSLRFVVRSAVVAAAVAIAGGAAIAVFAASLDDLVEHPARHGWTWDVALTCHEGYCQMAPDDVEALDTLLASDASVASWAFATFSTVELSGHDVPAVAATGGARSLDPFTITSGRAPALADEVALGAATLQELGVGLGDRVPANDRSLLVVGEAVFTGIGQADARRASLGAGAALTEAGLQSLVLEELDPDMVLVAAKPGATLAVDRSVPGYVVVRDRAPGNLAAWPGLRSLPLVAAAGLVLLAIGTIVHARSLSRRSNRSDLAVLWALGAQPKQVTAALRWQSTVILLLALLIGLPAGLVAGFQAWRLAAGALDIESPVRLASPHLAGVLLAAGLAAVLLAATVGPLRSDRLGDGLRVE